MSKSKLEIKTVTVWCNNAL